MQTTSETPGSFRAFVMREDGGMVPSGPPRLTRAEARSDTIEGGEVYRKVAGGWEQI